MTNTHMTPAEPDRNPFFGQGGNEPLTMSSREIADLCEKRHDHVLRDIRKMVEGLEMDCPQIWGEYTDPTGRALSCANLPKDLTLTLVSGYNVKLRKRIVDAWIEREENKYSLPLTYEEALQAHLDQVRANQALQLESAAKDSRIAAMQPKVDAYEAWLATEGVVRISDFCNKYGVKVNHPGYVLRERMMLHQKKTLATQVGIKSGIVRNVVSRDGFEYVDSKGQAVEAQTAMIPKDREAVLLRMIIDGYGKTAFRNPLAFQRAKMILSDGGEA